MFALGNLHYQISREKFEPELGFELRTSGFLARRSTTWAILVLMPASVSRGRFDHVRIPVQVRIFLLRSDNDNKTIVWGLMILRLSWPLAYKAKQREQLISSDDFWIKLLLQSARIAIKTVWQRWNSSILSTSRKVHLPGGQNQRRFQQYDTKS